MTPKIKLAHVGAGLLPPLERLGDLVRRVAPVEAARQTRLCPPHSGGIGRAGPGCDRLADEFAHVVSIPIETASGETRRD